MTTDDQTLLRQYLWHHSEAAFAELVERHFKLVYSTALRRVREPHLAQDVAQNVFIELARKPWSVRDPGALAGWLYRVASHAASNVLRTEARRRQRENDAMSENAIETNTSTEWQRLEPELDEAIQLLGAVDQNVIVLRFLEGKSLRETGESLSMTEDAVRKRANRALAKLRNFFARRGLTLSATALATLLLSNAQAAIPAGLVQATAAGALSAAASSAGITLTLMKLIAPLTTKPGLVILAAAAVIAAVVIGGPASSGRSASQPPVAARGQNVVATEPAAATSPQAPPLSSTLLAQEILARFVETNRYWLLGPPPAVHQLSYTLNRLSAKQEFAITNAATAQRARLQGVTYSTMLHQLALIPANAEVRSLTEEKGRIRLTLAFNPPIRGACGNGVETGWNGYFEFSDDSGYLVLDAKRLVPIEASLGNLTETFAEFVPVDALHYVPLAVTIQKDEIQFDWRFRLYEPGLWLFDDSQYRDQRVAWAGDVKVNGTPAVLRQATAASIAREAAEEAGAPALRAFLNANQQWLLPSLSARLGLIYEYRQEAPYLERVLFDPEGNAMVSLEATKENPEKATRQMLWLKDGRQVTCDSTNRYVTIEPASVTAGAPAENRVPLERRLQNVAMGLGWDCGLTALAREPGAFWVERLAADTAGQFLLVAHPRKDARLFAGTMLAFTSWAYMHDVRFDRSEILCDEATQRPLIERDFAGAGELRGEFFFEDWMNGSSGAMPQRIRAAIPWQKDGQDQSLEMNARFQLAKPGVSLLSRVESHFRGAEGGSTGTVTLATSSAAAFAPITELISRTRNTEQVLSAIRAAPEGIAEVRGLSSDWQPCVLRASWTEQARKATEADRDKSQPASLIGIHHARLESGADGTTQVSLDGITTATWKEFQTEWKVGWYDASGQQLGSAVATNVMVGADSGPAPFTVSIAAPSWPSGGNAPASVSIEGKVKRLSSMYMGSKWARFTISE